MRKKSRCAARGDQRCGAWAVYEDFRSDVGTVALCEVHTIGDVPMVCIWCGNEPGKDGGPCSPECRSNMAMAGISNDRPNPRTRTKRVVCGNRVHFRDHQELGVPSANVDYPE